MKAAQHSRRSRCLERLHVPVQGTTSRTIRLRCRADLTTPAPVRHLGAGHEGLEAPAVGCARVGADPEPCHSRADGLLRVLELLRALAVALLDLGSHHVGLLAARRSFELQALGAFPVWRHEVSFPVAYWVPTDATDNQAQL